MSDNILNQQENKILETDMFELPGVLTLDCRMNILSLHSVQKIIHLSESQKRLMMCLMNNIHSKQQIIKIVWHECHLRIQDNNYHQLVYQFRAMLTRNQLPSKMLVTIPHRGLVFNLGMLNEIVGDRKNIMVKSLPSLSPTPTPTPTPTKNGSNFLNLLRGIFLADHRSA